MIVGLGGRLGAAPSFCSHVNPSPSRCVDPVFPRAAPEPAHAAAAGPLGSTPDIGLLDDVGIKIVGFDFSWIVSDAQEASGVGGSQSGVAG